jgi:hypothetical protein
MAVTAVNVTSHSVLFVQKLLSQGCGVGHAAEPSHQPEYSAGS